MSDIFKNYATLGLIFILFALGTYLLNYFIGNEYVSYLIFTFIIISSSIFEKIGYLKYFRGFIKFSLLIFIPVSMFALNYLFQIPFGNFIMYISFFALVISFPILLWRLFNHKEKVSP